MGTTAKPLPAALKSPATQSRGHPTIRLVKPRSPHPVIQFSSHGDNA